MEPYHNREIGVHGNIERDIYLTDDSARVRVNVQKKSNYISEKTVF